MEKRLKLKTAREFKGKSQHRVARALGMTQTNYAKYENGHLKLTPAKFGKFMAAILRADGFDNE